MAYFNLHNMPKNDIIVVEKNMELKETRQRYNLSQLQASNITGVPLRTYVRYENDDKYGDDLKRVSMINILDNACAITETKGLLSIDTIKSVVADIFEKEYNGQIEFCYLFGSYAKGKASEISDIDLCVSTKLTGFKFVGISEKIRNALNKKIDLIKFSNLNNNIELINEIMKDGIKIYR